MNKVARDLGVGHAQAHQPEHLAFAVGDPGQFPGLAIGTVLAGELPDQAAGHARRDHGVAGRDHADGGQDVLQCHVLDQEPARPGPQRAVDVVVLVERGEHEHPGVRTGGGDQPGCLDAVHARHADVHDDHVGAGVPGEPYRLGSGSGLAGHVDIGGRSINLRNPARTSGWSSARMTCVPHDHSIDADLRSQMGDAAYEQAAAHGRSLTSTRAIQYGLEDPHQDPQQHEAARKQEVQPEQRRGA